MARFLDSWVGGRCEFSPDPAPVILQPPGDFAAAATTA
jgi:hypothetical protein